MKVSSGCSVERLTLTREIELCFVPRALLVSLLTSILSSVFLRTNGGSTFSVPVPALSSHQRFCLFLPKTSTRHRTHHAVEKYHRFELGASCIPGLGIRCEVRR